MNVDMTTSSIDYQRYIKKFDKYPIDISLLTYGLGLGGESGEVQEKIKKLYRDKGGMVDEEFKHGMVKEIGDVLWYLAMLCNKLGVTLEDCMIANMNKLDVREEKNLIHGDGDDREERNQ